jgi:hypothetical protein
LEWSSDDKNFRYWDKEIQVEGKEKPGANVLIPLPFRFLVLDQLNTIRGFSDLEKSGFWSNECRNVKTDIFTVRNKKGIASKGTYEAVMADKACVGSKFCKSVYILTKEGDEFIIANLQLVGSALGQWFDFCKNNKKIMEGAIEVKTFASDKKGKTEYNMPVFEKITTSPETEQKAIAADKELQEYLTAYFKRGTQSEAGVPENEILTEEDKNEALPFTPNVIGESDDLPF